MGPAEVESHWCPVQAEASLIFFSLISECEGALTASWLLDSNVPKLVASLVMAPVIIHVRRNL